MIESPDFWIGYLSAAVSLAATDIEAGRETEALRMLERTRDEYEASVVARPREIVGYAIVDRTGDCYAISDDEADAVLAGERAREYLFGAESCGHSMAVSWVEERLPIRVLAVDAGERADLLENGTPVLEREP